MMIDIQVIARRPVPDEMDPFQPLEPVQARRPRGVLKRSLLAQLESGPKTGRELAVACDTYYQAVYTILTRCGIRVSADGYYRLTGQK